jgi:hypothetical protein
MAGFLGGSSGSGGGGEIQFPAEFIDPVTKLRVSEPETLIDTDFEYGLQPTKWETVELINNTPSFFSKSGDTTINGILAMVTTATSREVKVTTQDNHGLAVGIPINVSGTKSITADGSYIINSIPDPKTFTYLAKQNQDFTASIFDLYTSIITGEFFQGSQIKISDSQGIVTNAGSPSVLTVQTDSPHGFQVGTPFYFLNLNSTVSQQFDASNTGAKTFDSSNSATAQTFDGSNTLTSYSIDLNNKALLTGTTSATQTHSTANKTITVLHSSETFVGKVIGTPLYHNVIASSGYFQTYPRGIVYLADNTFNVLGASTSTFSVSSIPGGTPIDIPSYPNGTFQLASNASLFAGNNLDLVNQITLAPTIASAREFDGTNTAGSLSTVNTYSGTIIQLNNDAGTTISSGHYISSMVQYTNAGGTPPTISISGASAGSLVNNATYFVTYYNEPAGASVPGFYQIKISATPGSGEITMTSNGSGTQKFRKIGVSVDRDIFHVPLHNLTVGDMVRYVYPSGGAVGMTNRTSDWVYVSAVYDTYNIQLDLLPGLTATGGTITNAAGYKIHTFTGAGTYTFAVTGTGTVEYMVIGGGGGGGTDMGGGGGAGGYLAGSTTFNSANYTITVGAGGRGARGLYNANEATLDYVSGGNSSIVGGSINIVAIGGGKGGSNHRWDSLPTVPALVGGSGGGMAGNTNASGASRVAGTAGQGFAGGVSAGTGYSGSQWYSGGGGGAGGQGLDGNLNGNTRPSGGPGVQNSITGTNYFWAGGGGGGIWSGTDNGVGRAGNGGSGGGGGGAGGVEHGAGGTGGLAVGQAGYGPNGQSGSNNNANGGTAGANTGSGGGGNSHSTTNDIRAGAGANGIVVVRYLNA